MYRCQLPENRQIVHGSVDDRRAHRYRKGAASRRVIHRRNTVGEVEITMSSPRHDADLMVIAQPDWWSRLLALGALVVAAAALYWTYLQERDVKPQEQDYLAEIKTAVNDGITADPDGSGSNSNSVWQTTPANPFNAAQFH